MNANNFAPLEQSIPVAISKNLQILVAAILGLIILFGVAFTPISIAHNATHDTRHSITLPCH